MMPVTQQNQTAPVVGSVNVLIIGGGAAGLACLKHLTNCSPQLRASLVESQHNLGGRVKSGLLGNNGNVVREAGAEFAYQDIFSLFDTLKVPYSRADFTPLELYGREHFCVFDSGKIISAVEFFGDYDPDQIHNQIFCEMKAYGSDISVEEFLTSHSKVFAELPPPIAKLIRQNLYAEYACVSLAEMGIVVLAMQAEDEEGQREHHSTMSGDIFRINGGYNKFVGRIGDKLDVHTANTVQSIAASDNGHYLVTMHDADRKTIQSIRAQYVVLAVPVPALANISLPPGVDYKKAIDEKTDHSFALGKVVKVLFEAEHSLLPSGMETLSCVDTPIEIWQRKNSDTNYQYTLWIPGPAAIDFQIRSGIGVNHGTLCHEESGSNAHLQVRSILSAIFGEQALAGINRFSIIPWEHFKNTGHAYRTAKPTGKPFEELQNNTFVKLANNLFIAGADVNNATVPSALQSGISTATHIIHHLPQVL